MGIGNGCQPAGPGSLQAHLITPHGDRERSGEGDVAVACPLLITPHGDREPAAQFRPGAPQGDLITPHGDREPGHSSSPASGRSESSLPLMGIGNAPALDPTSRRARLITPHGDREPAGAAFPSDGLSTSLPLMGIGNVQRQTQSTSALAPHYPSWGSGTGERARSGRHARSALITPHGDREPAARYPSHSVYAISLPLMGIGNGTASAANTTPTSAHYPSWGSGTADARCAYARLHRSHYPSWGSGT